MLGKGLESLIPPQRGNPGQPGQQNQSGQQSQPSGSPQPQQPAQPESRPEPIHAAEPAPIQFPAVEKVFEKALAANSPSKNETGADGSERIFQIEVDKIKPNPSQPRREFNQEALRDLAASIREFGLLQPLVVTKIEHETPSGVDVEFQLIAGERRFMASKLLGLRLVPAIIRKVTLEREKLELAIIENIQRENLNPVETARAFQRLQEEFKLTQREIASKLGKSREAVANSVRLLDLPPYIQEALQKGELSESHGRLLLAIEDPAIQKKLFEDITTFHLTTRDVKERVERMKKTPAEREEIQLAPEVRAMKESLAATLGAPVDIKKGASNGKISITFYSEEELENILRRLGRDGGMM
jgi:ParB family chromosome partitioning protein